MRARVVAEERLQRENEDLKREVRCWSSSWSRRRLSLVLRRVVCILWGRVVVCLCGGLVRCRSVTHLAYTRCRMLFFDALCHAYPGAGRVLALLFLFPNVALRRCKRSVDRSAPSPRLSTAKPAARLSTVQRRLPRRPRRATRWRGRPGQVASLVTVALGGAARRGGARRPSSLHPRHVRRTAVAAADGRRRPSDFRLHSCVVVEQPPPPSRGVPGGVRAVDGGRRGAADAPATAPVVAPNLTPPSLALCASSTATLLARPASCGDCSGTLRGSRRNAWFGPTAARGGCLAVPRCRGHFPPWAADASSRQIAG